MNGAVGGGGPGYSWGGGAAGQYGSAAVARGGGDHREPCQFRELYRDAADTTGAAQQQQAFAMVRAIASYAQLLVQGLPGGNQCQRKGRGIGPVQ